MTDVQDTRYGEGEGGENATVDAPRVTQNGENGDMLVTVEPKIITEGEHIVLHLEGVSVDIDEPLDAPVNDSGINIPVGEEDVGVNSDTVYIDSAAEYAASPVGEPDTVADNAEARFNTEREAAYEPGGTCDAAEAMPDYNPDLYQKEEKPADNATRVGVNTDELLPVETFVDPVSDFSRAEEEAEYARILKEEEARRAARRKGSTPPTDYDAAPDTTPVGVPAGVNVDFGTPDATAKPKGDGDAEKIVALDRAERKRQELQEKQDEENDYRNYLNKYGETDTKSGKADKRRRDDEAAADEKKDEKESRKPLFVDETNENVTLVEARINHEIEGFKHRDSMASYVFTVANNGKRRSRIEDKREIKRRAKLLKKAKACERTFNEKIYYIAADRSVLNPKKRSKNAPAIASVVRRMKELLEERSVINEKLLKLYTGTDVVAKKSENKKANRIKEHAAKKTYKAQRRTAREVGRLSASVDMKERIFDLMNRRTTLTADIAYSKYVARRAGKAERRELERTVKEARRELRYIDADIQHFIKKAQRQNEKSAADKTQMRWIGIFIALLALVGVAAYVYFGLGIGFGFGG